MSLTKVMNNDTSKGLDFSNLARIFMIPGRVIAGIPYGSGHINDTFLIAVDQAGATIRYIFQRINERVFKNVPALMNNIQRVSEHTVLKAMCEYPEDSSRRALTLLQTGEKQPYHKDDFGKYWRCYLFVERARTHDVITHENLAYEAASAFGRFQSLLIDLPGERLNETIPNFHNTRHRFDQLIHAIQQDSCNRASDVKTEIDFALKREPMVDLLCGPLQEGTILERITHNDTKLNNVMLDDLTHKGICVIDLDTVMPGLVLYDFGDMVRTATSAALEDETDTAKVEMRMSFFEALVRGYASTAGSFLTTTEREHLAFSGKLMTFENGIRFLTDYLEGDPYYKIKHPRHNLDRCRNQFALVRQIESKEVSMQSLVERVFRDGI